MTPHDLAVDTESLDTASIELRVEDVESLSAGPAVLDPAAAPPVPAPAGPAGPAESAPDRPEST
ncbi:hypothetical protein [Goodfellowiella coeruleoviolacea]|uniref:Uncharacterized protein n=1 Tax=Goodfellowiella coeruleoviolacea TaxID=334858 RepID=A0AAE3KGT3_9PSEU|nr:hypothetical protein [Goodfellowiella coeruleoviolacea]MCP2166550.1 hypothetical protein [Goodfellowiella coeruleoviolacea]